MKQIRKPLALLLSAALALSCGSTLALAAGPDNSENCLSIFAQQNKPAVTVTSNILGLADTGNKTSLKKTLQKTSGPGDINIYYYNEAGKRVTYAPGTVVQLDPVQYTGSALISLGDNIDDSKIDSSQAVVRLVDGNTYHADEFVLSTAASTLNGTWQNGTYTYALNTGDLEWNTWGYTWNDYNSGREWSIMGGDGAGDYFFTFEVSGIRYDGKELDPVTFPVTVYCYGRTVTDLALSHVYEANTYDASYTSGKQQSLVPQWTWYTEGAESAADNGQSDPRNGCRVTVTQEPSMIVIRANTPDQVLEQTILSLLQQAQIEAEQITFCAKKKLELPGLVIDNTRHEISANGRNISLTRLESDLLWVLAVCEGTTLSKKELFDAVWGKDCADTLKVVGNTVSNLRKKLAFCGLDGCLCTVGGGYAFRYVLAQQGKAHSNTVPTMVSCCPKELRENDPNLVHLSGEYLP